MANNWTVNVQDVRHTITVERDPSAGRSMIRIDGRMAAKPMADAETEREITVGNTNYVIRRVGEDEFDLDIPPETFLNKRQGSASRAHSEPSGGAKKKILAVAGGLVALVIVAGLVRFGREGFAYMRVPWTPYGAPDATFKAAFPGAPARSEDKININGDLWNFISLEGTYRNHYYSVEYVDLHMIVTEQQAPKILDEFFTGWMTAIGAKVLEKEATTLARNPAISFQAMLPKGTGGEGEEKLKVDALKRGVIALRDKRIVVASTMSAKADPISADLTKFLESFELSPPDRRSMVLTSMVDAPPEAPAPAPAATDVLTFQGKAGTVAKPIVRVYAHNATGRYYPENCPGRPADAYPVARSIAASQGFRLAANCTE